MATKKKTTQNVTRITASSSSKKKTKTASAKADNAEATPKKVHPSASSSTLLKPLKISGGYFKGSWSELRQVRWPTRAATWSLTGAVLAFTAFFVVLILLLDAGFKYLFEQLLG